MRKWLWDAVALIGVAGIIYGVWQSIEAYGVWQGGLLAAAAAVLGYMALVLIYPMWFGR